MKRFEKSLGGILLAAQLCALAGAASAASPRVWTGQGDCSSWYDPLNWSPNGVPTADDVVTFNTSATVKLDRNGEAACWAIAVEAGDVRIATDSPAMTGSFASTADYDGPYLAMKSNAAGADVNGWNVKKGAKLDVAVPTWCETRTDKWYGGELWFHAPLRLKATSYFGYGTNCFAQGANVYADVNFHVGLGTSETGLRDCVIFKDNAVFNGGQIRFCGSGACTPNVLEIDGDDVRVDVNHLNLNPQSTWGDQCLIVKRGWMRVNSSFMTEQNDSVSPGHVLVSGGELIVKPTLYCYAGTVRVEGGKLELRSGMSFGGDTYLDFAGGTLALQYLETASDHNFRLDDKVRVTGEDVTFDIPQGGIFHWNFDRAVIGANTKIRKSGAGDVRFSRSEAVSRPLEVVSGSATVASGVTLTAPDGSDAAWPLALGDGAEFRFADITSRLSLPVDVAITGSGRFAFANGSPTARGLVVARSVIRDGDPLGKGRYAAASGLVSGSTGSSLVIPYRWTGAGGSTSFVDPGNWEGGVVPPSGLNTPVDLSAATRVEISGDYSLTSVVYLPTGANRAATLAVDGTLSLVTDESNWYACAAYVKEGCRLALDAQVVQRGDTRGPMSLIGGGTVSMKGDFPGLLWTDGAVNYLPFSIDGTLAFNGVSRVYKGNINPNDFPFLTLWTHEVAGCGKVLIEDGADVSAMRLFVGDDRFCTLDEVRQTGGAATFGSVYLEKTAADAGRASYFLEDGTLTVNGTFGLGTSYNSTINPLRRPGPSMTMTGGVWNQNGPLSLYGNQNRVKVLGGTVALGGNWEISTAGGSCAAVEPNTDHFYFGGATLKASVTSQINGNVTLTGLGGDTILVSEDVGLTLGHWGGTASVSGTARTVSGPGGIVMNGSETVSVDGVMTFTGGITVNNTYYAYIGNDVASEALNGPRFIKVNNATCKVIVRPTVLKDPEVISVKNAANFICSGNFAKGHDFKVKRYILNDVEQADGTYQAGSCTITVQRDLTWLNGDKGNLSYVGDSVLDGNVTLSELRYTPFEPEAAFATLSGDYAVTLADGAVIEVGAGETLVVAAPVSLAGAVRKIGLGKVVFARAVTGAATLTVEEGEAAFTGSLGEATVAASAGVSGIVPVVTLGDGLVVDATASLAVDGGARLVLDGMLNFTQTDAADEQTFDQAFEGEAVIVQTGAGTLTWASPSAPAEIRVQAGAVRLGTGAADLSETALVLLDDAGVDVPGAGAVAVKSVLLNERTIKAGEYPAGFRALGARVSGPGVLRVLTGVDPGLKIIVK